MGLDGHQKCLPTNAFCASALQHPQTPLLVLQPVADLMNQNFNSISISPSLSALSQSFIAHVLLPPSALQLQPAAPTSQDLVFTDRTVNYVISCFVNLCIQMKPLPAQHTIVPLGILISEQTPVQLCCTELTDLKAKSPENRILHLPVNCTLNSICNYLLFSPSLDYFIPPSTFA